MNPVRARGRTGGRKSKLTPAAIGQARLMYEAKDAKGKRLRTFAEIASAFKVTRRRHPGCGLSAAACRARREPQPQPPARWPAPAPQPCRRTRGQRQPPGPAAVTGRARREPWTAEPRRHGHRGRTPRSAAAGD
ncbi:hypothetical protein [Streptomyces yangpuensis]|uniref:hypothetical protein n=1 Tax=Streptomyces yangpuensis TaxID=1648182 RepID=UPI00382D1BD6